MKRQNVCTYLGKWTEDLPKKKDILHFSWTKSIQTVLESLYINLDDARFDLENVQFDFISVKPA